MRKSGKRVLNPTPSDPDLEARLDWFIDMDTMLRTATVNAFTSNPDELFNKGKNFHWVDFGSDEPRRYFPWDLDSSIRGTTANIYGSSTVDRRGKVTTTQHPYQSIILNHPRFRARYNQILTSLLEGPMHPAVVASDLDRVEGVLTGPLLEDPNNKIGSSPGAVSAFFKSLRSWLGERGTNVLNQVRANKNPAPRPDY